MAKHLSVKAAYNPILSRRKVRNPEPDRHYRWVKGDPDRISYMIDAYGYRVERNNKQLKVGDASSLEGAITSGPSSDPDVLMSCPKDEFLARCKERERVARAQLEGPRETFKTEASKHGVETEDNTKMSRGTMDEVQNER